MRIVYFQERGHEAKEVREEEAVPVLQGRSQSRKSGEDSEELPQRQVQGPGSVVVLEQEDLLPFFGRRKEAGMGIG